MAKYTLADVAEAPPAKRYTLNDVAEQGAPDVSKLDSAARGALQGGTAGFSDELAGAAESPMKLIADWIAGNKGKDAKGYYQEFRDEERAKNDAARAANPKSYGAGETAGMIGSSFIPGMGEATIAKMGALGGLQGLGNSHADLVNGGMKDWKESGIDTLKGAGAGAAGAAAVTGAGKVLEKGLDPAFWKDIAGSEAAKALGFSKRFLNTPEKLATAKQAGQTMLDEGVVTPFATPKVMASRVDDLLDQSGRDIGQFLRARGNGYDTNSAVQAINALRPKSAEGQWLSGGHYDTLNQMLDKAIDTVKAHGDTIPFEEANKLKGFLQKLAPWNASSAEAETGRNIAGAMKGSIDDTLEKAASATADPTMAFRGYTPSEGQQQFQNFLANKSRYKAGIDAQDALTNRLSSEEGNKAFGLTDTILGSAGAAAEMATGHLPLGTAALIGAKKLGEKFGHQTAAVAADTAAKGTQWIGDKIPSILQTAPQAFGRYAPLLQQAAQAGGEAVAVRHWLLMNNDPEYRQQIRQMEENQ